MMNLDTDLDRLGVTRITRTTLAVSETVAVVRQPSAGTTFVGKRDEDWTWTNLRDYVVHEIETRRGTFARSELKEASIFKSFLARWGDKAVAIARYAFEQNDGYWNGHAVTVTSFCKGSDPYFGEPISEKIHHQSVQGW